MSLIEKAKELVLGERNKTYGDPANDYGKTSLMWTGLLRDKLKDGAIITPKDCTLMMIAVKLSREMYLHKPDNLIDIHGYALCAEWIETGIKPENETTS